MDKKTALAVSLAVDEFDRMEERAWHEVSNEMLCLWGMYMESGIYDPSAFPEEGPTTASFLFWIEEEHENYLLDAEDYLNLYDWIKMVVGAYKIALGGDH